ncbi:LysM and BON domain-containing protein [Roseomonas sp. OT10]|uniref:LysM and BON domain-containing protein n=1 Tax=Roseomonas cutis TaxID=2897332 RepID=UPI001E483EF1|nr:LysM and BON domain-containing protein [Roseomonas sp. OT10]UFN48606.1 LysM and BON domain-containing protein [Roseomonas sp. OT10]
MGLFSFLESVGKALGVGGAAAATPAPTPEALKAELEKLGLPTQGIEIGVEGGTVTLRGTAPAGDVREKIVLAVGNVQGISKVDDQLAAPAGAAPEAAPAAAPAAGAPTGEQGPAGSAFYTVKKGDTLSAISKSYYGDPNKYQQIFEANRPMLEHPDKIYPGQVLRIPPKAA